MTPERYRQIGELYHAALEVDADKRAGFLDAACASDAELRREVETLIASHEKAADFIADPALEVTAEQLAKTEARALTGQTIGRYRVESLLGSGGMGRVFLAKDTELGRRVALKLLPEYVTHDESQVQRFRREARAASALNHPNIVTIHEIGQADAVHFIATEFIDGETLREQMSRRRMTVGEVLDVAVQVASALQAAHDAGIVHRDVKPENIMLRRDGIAKVLDFGLAKLAVVATGAPAQSVKTTPGMVMGTVGYMSPEQARGQEVDARTDIWSFGVVLYEMLAGRLPFAGETTSDLLAAILTTEPSPQPDELQHIVRKCLQKSREQRYQTAKELLVDLRQLQKGLEKAAELQTDLKPPLESSRNPRRRLAVITAILVMLAGTAAWMTIGRDKPTPPAPAAAAIKSVAVLPFVNLSGSAENDYLSDAMSEEVINALSRLPGLRVVARTSSSAFKGQQRDVREVGRQLGVGSVVEGSVQKSGNRLRVSAQLVSVDDGYNLWSDRFDREMTDVFAIQDEIATAVASALQARLTAGRKLVQAPTADLEAYALYIRGRDAASVIARDRFERAIVYYRAALDRDPQFAEVWAGLADLYSLMDHRPNVTSLPPAETNRLALDAARKALALDPDLAEAHAAMGHIQTHLGEFAEAERHLKRAVELNPNSGIAHLWYATLLRTLRRDAEAMAEFHRTREVDPASVFASHIAATNLWFMGEFEEGWRAASAGLRFAPEVGEFYMHQARNSASLGRDRQAQEEYSRAMAAPQLPPYPDEERALHLALLNRKKEAAALLARIERENPRPVAMMMLRAYSAGIDLDAAARWLDRMLSTQPEYLRVALSSPPVPVYEAWRADPRYQAARKRLGLPVD